MIKHVLLATFSIGLMVSPLSSQTPPRCLHGADERPDHRARRDQALMLALQINRAENPGPTVAPLQRRTYRPLDQLADLPPTPEGFKVQFNTDGATYTFSIKDTLDPCRYGVFSDQERSIYEATPRADSVSLRPTDLVP